MTRRSLPFLLPGSLAIAAPEADAVPLSSATSTLQIIGATATFPGAVYGYYTEGAPSLFLARVR